MCALNPTVCTEVSSTRVETVTLLRKLTAGWVGLKAVIFHSKDSFPAKWDFFMNRVINMESEVKES